MLNGECDLLDFALENSIFSKLTLILKLLFHLFWLLFAFLSLYFVALCPIIIYGLIKAFISLFWGVAVAEGGQTQNIIAVHLQCHLSFLLLYFLLSLCCCCQGKKWLSFMYKSSAFNNLLKHRTVNSKLYQYQRQFKAKWPLSHVCICICMYCICN